MVDISKNTKDNEILRLLHRIFDVDGEYSIRDGLISIVGDCIARYNLDEVPLGQLPVNFDEIRGVFSVAKLGISSFTGFPRKCTSLVCTYNDLSSLIGSPKEMIAIDCSHNDLTNFVGLPRDVVRVEAVNNPLTSLEGLVKANVFLSYNRDLPLLRLLKVKKFQLISDMHKTTTKVTSILKKFHKGDVTSRSDILACQRELIKAGYEGNARW